MSQKTTLPGMFNPAKASRHMGERSKAAKKTVAAFWERTKTSDPVLYQKHLKEEAFLAAQQPIIDAMLDDPAVRALLDDLKRQNDINKQRQMTNELTLLGIEAGATKREVRNAYRRKARKLHPDVGGDAEAFKQLHAAYRAVLKVAPNEL
jgi:hypothetical protein